MGNGNRADLSDLFQQVLLLQAKTCSIRWYGEPLSGQYIWTMSGHGRPHSEHWGIEGVAPGRLF